MLVKYKFGKKMALRGYMTPLKTMLVKYKCLGFRRLTTDSFSFKNNAC